MGQINNPFHWAVQKKRQLLQIDFVRFVIAGLVGFVLTAIALQALHGALGISIFFATLMSSEVGLLTNFFFHENWTYKHVDHHHKSKTKKLIHFHMSSWSGVVILTVVETLLVKVVGINYLIGLVIGTGITLFWNFFWTKYFIFKKRTPAILLDVEDTVLEKNQ